MIPVAPRSEDPALRTLKALVFALAGLVMLRVAVYCVVSTRDFLARAHVAEGEVVRLNAGGSHPEVRFVTDKGQEVEYPQGGMIGGYHAGDHVTVLYDPENPAMSPVLNTFGALWGFNITDFLMGAVFLLAAWSMWREGRSTLHPPPLPGR